VSPNGTPPQAGEAVRPTWRESKDGARSSLEVARSVQPQYTRSRMYPSETQPIGIRELVLRVAALGGVLVALLAALILLVRPWYLHWGATPDEYAGVLPGDELSPGAVNDTRAIDIAAPAANVFAWVAQLGQNRAGFYSYTTLENLVGCRMPDVRRLDPALQQWRLGDKLWMYPPDQLGGMGHATLLRHDPGRVLVFGTHTPLDPPGSAPTGLWSFVVEPTGDHSARLLTRGSGGAMPSLLGQAFTRTLFEPLHFAMERRMLEGIQGLAEGHPISRLTDSLQLLSWAAVLALFIGSGVLVLIGSNPERHLLGFAAAGVAFQVVTLIQPMPIVGLMLVIALGLFIGPRSRDRAPESRNLAKQES
jgi:hypothetical protein